jgi:choline dehydrogenase-like flavoprotein
LDSLVEAVKFGLTISKTEPLASAIVGRQDPAPGVVTDADIADYIKNNVESVYHPIGRPVLIMFNISHLTVFLVGTAALAPRSSGGVVGSNLKVYGTTNVRVVCAFAKGK